MDDTRLIVEVEKLKVIYDPKNCMYKDLQAKEKAMGGSGLIIDNTRRVTKNKYYSIRHKNITHVATPNKSMMWVTCLKVCFSCVC